MLRNSVHVMDKNIPRYLRACVGHTWLVAHVFLKQWILRTSWLHR